MKKMQWLLAAAGVLAASSYALPALAAVSSTASIANLQFYVYDLDPDDGIAAGFQIGYFQTPDGFPIYPAPTDLTGYALALDGSGSYINNGTSVYFDTLWDSAASSGSSLALFAGPDYFHATGQATTAGSGYVGSASTGTYAGPLDWQYNLLVTPNTAVYIGAIAQVSASAQDGCASGYGCDYAAASVALNLTRPGTDGTGTPIFSSSSFSAVAGGLPGGLGGPVTNGRTDLLTASFINLGADYGVGSLYIEAKVSGYAALSAVPEPGAAWMGLAGLGLLAARLRRGGRTAGAQP